MLDVHAIAKNQLANPITDWAVFTVQGNVCLGEISKTDKGFQARDAFGITTNFRNFMEARDWFASQTTMN